MRILIGVSVYEKKTTLVGLVEKRKGQYLVIFFPKKETKGTLHRVEVVPLAEWRLMPGLLSLGLLRKK